MHSAEGGTHTTVLLAEAVEALVTDAAGVYIDGTFGRGGHSRLALARLASEGRLYGVDKDPQAVAVGETLAAEDSRFAMVHDSFADALQHREWPALQGVLLDLGVSSPQLDDAERGFSFSQDGPLDMRMNTSAGISAADWVAAAAVEEMQQVFRDYGEERFARRIANAIVEARAEQAITRTAQLAKIVAEANPAWEKHKHPATRVFQAIRIHVNQELADLQRLLDSVIDRLAIGGRLVVISFHSLEDRMVKRFMRDQSRGQVVPRHVPVTEANSGQRLRLIGKAIKPSADEVAANVRARSAVMRVAERVA